MKESSCLIDKISRDLQIPRYMGEKDSEWISRILYSATGRIALGSLWDRAEEEEVSVIRFKKKIEKTWNAYLDIYPDFATEYNEETMPMVEEIYSLYEREGFFYHSPNKVVPCKKTGICFENIIYLRGHTFDTSVSISGLGEYAKASNRDANYIDLARMFCVDHSSLEEYYKSTIETIKWNVINEKGKIEYLRTQPPFLRGYWKEQPDLDGSISLLRLGSKSGYLYYIYKYSNGAIMGEEIPEWKTGGYKYRKLANSILYERKVLPPIEIQENDKCVFIRFNYLPAWDLHNFLKLYSWPKSIYKVPCDFSRVISRTIWKSVKMFIEELGYMVEELHV